MSKVSDVKSFSLGVKNEPYGPSRDLRCVACPEWCGRCRKGKVNRIAWSPVCQEFADIINKFSSEAIMLPLIIERVKI